MRRAGHLRRTAMKFGGSAALVVLASLLFFFPLGVGPAHASTQSIYMSVSPTKGAVGSGMIVTGTGFPPDETITLNWVTDNTTWAVGLSPAYGDTTVPEVNGINSVPWTFKLASVETNASGAFSQSLKVPTDDNGQKVIEAVGAGFNSSQAQAVYVVEPSFTFSPTSGPAGTPITISGTGLGNRQYALEYEVNWDNGYVGYMTGLTTHGNGNFTLYATGAPGVHAITIYSGFPGESYLNPQQSPASVSITTYDPPLIPFHGQFTITSPTTQSSQGLSMGSILSLLFLGLSASALVSTPVLAMKTHVRRGIGKYSVLIIIGVLGLATVGMAAMVSSSGSLGGSTAAQNAKTVTVTSTATITTTASTPAATGAGYVPQAVTLRPITTITTHEATTGPRITVTPDVATVGTPVNVTGQGFTPGQAIPLTWTTHTGNHITGFVNSLRSLKNVTANSAGSFSFTMATPADLEGTHQILTPMSTDTQANGTLYIERIASLSSQEGPSGSVVTITMKGTGWDYQDNTVAVDFDNSYIGYGCGFNTNGNITIYLTVTGAPGYHSIDLWPALYTEYIPASNTPAQFLYPMLTPFDGPEGIPAFHFSYYITSNSTQSSQSFGGTGVLALMSGMGIGLGSVLLIAQAVSPLALEPTGPRGLRWALPAHA